MKILHARAGVLYCIEGLEAEHKWRIRLQDLGLVRGSQIFLLARGFGGIVLVELNGTKIAISKELASKICVIEAEKVGEK